MPQVPWTDQAADGLYWTIFTCDKCDADDPEKAADKWIKGDLKRRPFNPRL
jgi:hypothetical protein